MQNSSKMRMSHYIFTLLSYCVFAAQSASLTDSVALLPPCALSCLTSAVLSSSCDITDTTCICTNTSLTLEVEACVLDSCTIKDGLITKNVTSATCGIPLRNKSDRTHLSNIALSVVTATIGLVRLGYNAFFSSIGWGYDDYLMVAVLFTGAPSVVIIDRMSIPNGLGHDVWSVPFHNITDFVKSVYGLEILYFVQIVLVKATLLFFFLRIFPRQAIRRLIQYTLVFNTLFGIAFTIIAIFPCYPISYYWTNWSQDTKGRCIDINAVVWANAAISIIVDVWMLALPLYEVFRLQMSWRNRLSVALMFFVGTFVTIVSMIRLRYLVVFSIGRNPTWDQANVINWSNIEINVGIICASLPTVRVILTRACPKILETTRKSSQSSSRKGSTYKMQKLDDYPEIEVNPDFNGVP